MVWGVPHARYNAKYKQDHREWACPFRIRQFTARNIVTNGTGRPVPYKYPVDLSVENHAHHIPTLVIPSLRGIPRLNGAQ